MPDLKGLITALLFVGFAAGAIVVGLIAIVAA